MSRVGKGFQVPERTLRSLGRRADDTRSARAPQLVSIPMLLHSFRRNVIPQKRAPTSKSNKPKRRRRRRNNADGLRLRPRPRPRPQTAAAASAAAAAVELLAPLTPLQTPRAHVQQKQQPVVVDLTADDDEPAQAPAGEQFLPGRGLTTHDLASLAPRAWLNDAVIDAAGALVGDACPDVAYTGVHWASVASGGERATLVRLNARRAGESWNTKRAVLAPFCANQVHWLLFVLQPRDRRVLVLDSLSHGLSPTHRSVAKALGAALDAQGGSGTAAPWEVTWGSGARQDNDSDCGVFVCEWMRRVGLHVPLDAPISGACGDLRVAIRDAITSGNGLWRCESRRRPSMVAPAELAERLTVTYEPPSPPPRVRALSLHRDRRNGVPADDMAGWTAVYELDGQTYTDALLDLLGQSATGLVDLPPAMIDKIFKRIQKKQ